MDHVFPTEVLRRSGAKEKIEYGNQEIRKLERHGIREKRS
jgi:hypothetical protein